MREDPIIVIVMEYNAREMKEERRLKCLVTMFIFDTSSTQSEWKRKRVGVRLVQVDLTRVKLRIGGFIDKHSRAWMPSNIKNVWVAF